MPKYRAISESDPIRGGVGVFLRDASQRTVAEVFRCDLDHTVVIDIKRSDIPPHYFEHLYARARLVLDPFEDGTPLSSARRYPPELRKPE